MTNPLASALGVGDSALVQLATGGALAVEGSSGGGGAVNFPDEGTIVAPPVAADWTLFNMSLATLVDAGVAGQPTIYLSDFTDGASDNTRGGLIANPAGSGGSYTLTACFRPLLVNVAGLASGCGLVLQNAAGQQIFFGYVETNAGMVIQVVQRNSAASFHANAYDIGQNFGQNARVWFRVKNNGVLRVYSCSTDGENFAPVFSEVVATWLANNETLLGIAINILSSTAGAAMTLESFTLTTP